MCGIIGFNWNDRKILEKMSKSISYRGPDSTGYFNEDCMSLGQNRLAIIDLSSSANQPMFDNEENAVITFNGEIYNFLELKKELLNYQFKTKSDTEVILAGYQKWGTDVVNHLNGIFSFAIWDKKNKRLFCARDHMGVKPFYYYWDGKRFIFASEIKAILVHNIPRQLNTESFNRYMRVLYAPEPETMINGLFKLSPGASLILENDNIVIKKYYTPVLNEKDWDYTDAMVAVKNAVNAASVRQLVSDVPVGIYLSGGIDSSVILSAVSKIKNNVKTFSVGFDLGLDEEFEKFNRDFYLASKTSAHFGAEHHGVMLSIKDVASSLEETLGHMDDPISNPTSLAMAHLSAFAKKHVSVVLSGNGGDELFGGYERYRLSAISDIARSIPGIDIVGWFSENVRKLLTTGEISRVALFEFEKDPNLKKVISSEYFTTTDVVGDFFEKYLVSNKDFINVFMNFDQKSWLPDYALLLSDKMSMKNSIEERTPFLDREVVDLALEIPRSFKVNAFQTKKILKDAFRDELLETVIKEPKRGWFSPGAKWLRRKEISQIARQVFSSQYHVGTGTLFNWDELNCMFDRHLEKKEYNLTILWAILSFQIWARKNNVSL